MKTRPKFFSFITSLFLGLFLAGCSQAPKEVDGKPVHVLDVFLAQPLEINTDKEQELYFRFKRQPDSDINYLISAVVILPSISPDYEEYQDLDRKLVEEKMLPFEVALTYYDKDGKTFPVGLKQYHSHDSIKAGITDYNLSFDKKRFDGFLAVYTGHGIEGGYRGVANGLAVFNPEKRGGYYRLSIRALQQYRNYPKMKLGIYIAPEYTGK